MTHERGEVRAQLSEKLLLWYGLVLALLAGVRCTHEAERRCHEELVPLLAAE